MDTFFSVGLKIVAALGIGAAVYLGLGSLKDKKQESPKPQQPQSGDSNSNSNTQQQPPQQRSIEITKPETKGEKVVEGLKTAQEVCGRAFTLCQNLVLVAENLRSVFSPQGQYQYDNQPRGVGQGGYDYGYRDPYNNGYQDKYKDPPGFRRVSPFILEWVGVSNTQQPPQQNGPWRY